MAVSLLNLRDGSKSLEFEESDAKMVFAAINKYYGPMVGRENYVVLDVIRVQGVDLTYYYEWDPCLISSCTDGSAMLSDLHQKLAEDT